MTEAVIELPEPYARRRQQIMELCPGCDEEFVMTALLMWWKPMKAAQVYSRLLRHQIAELIAEQDATQEVAELRKFEVELKWFRDRCPARPIDFQSFLSEVKARMPVPLDRNTLETDQDD